LSDSRSLPIGYVLSDYRIEGILGQGGFGITYLATDTNLQRKVAIKEYYPREFAIRDSTLTIRASGDKDDRDTFTWGLSRFRDEARLLARFNHPNIVAVSRTFDANGTAYLVMDYCYGKPLDEIIKKNGPLSEEQLNQILYPLLDGLKQIHSINFLHRDIKPANIFIRNDGSPVLLDFGAARQEVDHSRSVTSLATAGYAAFEQYSTKGKQGPWTDIYGLGATLYRAVTGEKPDDSNNRILEDTLVPASKKVAGRYARRLLTAIDAGMAVRPDQRPQTVDQWRELFGTEKRKIKKKVGNVKDNKTSKSENAITSDRIIKNTRELILISFSNIKNFFIPKEEKTNTNDFKPNRYRNTLPDPEVVLKEIYQYLPTSIIIVVIIFCCCFVFAITLSSFLDKPETNELKITNLNIENKQTKKINGDKEADLTGGNVNAPSSYKPYFKKSYIDLDTKSLVANVSGSRKVMQVSLSLMTFYEDRVAKNIGKHRVILRSAVLNVLRQVTEPELTKPDFRIDLAQRLRDRINAELERLEDFGGIEEVFFTEFVYQ